MRVPDGGRPSIGELLRSDESGVLSSADKSPVSLMCPRPRFGRLGNTSSTGFLGVRTRLGDPAGLEGRCSGEESMWPAALNPGKDCARVIGCARALVVDFDLKCPREYGDVFRGR
jgi:hypothetical protein